MARGIIALEEYTDSSDPNDLDFSTFESVISGEAEEITGDLEMAVDTIDDVGEHNNLTNIIATEGYGNRPEIARIALASIEKRLFGKPVVATRVGTESRTRIAIEGKNVFVRAWQAIVKFLKNLWKKIKAFFGADGEKKSKKKKKEVDSAKVDAVAEAIDKVDESAIESGKDTSAPEKKAESKPESSAIKMMKALRNAKELFAYDGSKLHGPKELLGLKLFKEMTGIPSLIDSEAKKITEELEQNTFKLLEDVSGNLSRDEDTGKHSVDDANSLAMTVDKAREELAESINKTFKNKTIPGMIGVVESDGSDGVSVPKLMVLPDYDTILENNIEEKWLKVQAKYLLKNKSQVSTAFDDIMVVQRQLLKHGEKIEELSRKLEKLIGDGYTDKEADGIIMAAANASAKNLISWYQSLIMVGSASVKFGDTAHRLITMCDETYTQGDPNYVK